MRRTTPQSYGAEQLGANSRFRPWAPMLSWRASALGLSLCALAWHTPAAAATPTPGAPAVRADASVSDARAEPSGETPSEGPTADRSSGLDGQFIGGMVSWAAGMGFVVAFNYAFFRLNDVVTGDEMKAYRQGVPAGDSSCERARAGAVIAGADAPAPGDIVTLCDEADSMQILRNVALPTGLVLGVLGAVLIGTSDTVNGPTDEPRQAQRWHLNGGVGPNGGGASLSVAF